MRKPNPYSFRHLAILVGLLFCCLALPAGMQGQVIAFFDPAYSSGDDEWVVELDDGSEGSVRLRWPGSRDRTEWSFQIGELYGSIQMPDKTNPGRWELRSGISVWRMEARAFSGSAIWDITDNTQRYVFQSRYNNIRREWSLRSDQECLRLEGDNEIAPRHWDCLYREDTESPPLLLQLACVFLASRFSAQPR